LQEGIVSFVTWKKKSFEIVWGGVSSIPADFYETLELDPWNTFFTYNGRCFVDAEHLFQSLMPGSVVYCCQRLPGGMKRSEPSSSSRSSREGSRIDKHFPSTKQNRTSLEYQALAQASRQMDEAHTQNSSQSRKCDGILWVKNIENEELAPFESPPADLAAVQNIESLCQLLYNLNQEYAQCTGSNNNRSIMALELINDNHQTVPFIIIGIDPVSSKKQIRQGKELWSFEENCSSNPLLIKLQPTCYHKFSSRCLDIFKNPSYFQEDRKLDGTIYEKLRLPALALSSRQKTVHYVLGSGLSFSESGIAGNRHPSPRREESVTADAGHTTGEANWRSQTFPAAIYLSDLKMISRNEDCIEHKTTRAIENLKKFIQDREQGQCVLNFHPEHFGRAQLQSGIPCYNAIHCRCSGRDGNGNPCSHHVRYNYASLSPAHGVAPCQHPVFLMANSQAYETGHTCKREETRLFYGKPTHGKPAIPPEQLQRAIWCLACAIPLNHIVFACGYDPLQYPEFELKMRQFRDAIRYKLRADKESDMDVLLRYLEKRVEEGHTAFACVEGVAGSVDKMRIFLQSAEQICFLKEERVTAISLDFVYKLIPNVGLCFGHFTTMSPSGGLITLATFLVETENGDAIDWIFQRYEESLKNFGIKCQSPVRNHNHSQAI
jgi:hypothetical protein